MIPTGAVSTASDAVPPELVDRFRAALDRLNPQGGRIGLAVSGGPDSMAMLLLAHSAIPGGFEVATVNHGLRPEAKDECALVEAACAARGIPCAVLTVEVGAGNLQEQARIARYDALTSWAAERGLGSIATAHHADDQAETLLMRLNRGSGLAGLAGVREATWSEDYVAAIIRPVLRFRRAELATLVAAGGLAVAQDPSNTDDSFDRVRIRAHLAQADWLDPAAMAQSALNLAEADDALEHVSRLWWETEARRENDMIVMRLHPARAIRLRAMDRAIREFGGDPRGGDVARLDEAIMRGGKANVGGVVASSELREDGPFLVFRPEPPRRTG